jgi:hypothetical protein
MLTHDDIACLAPAELASLYYDDEVSHLIENLEVCSVDENGVVDGIVYDPR